MTDETGRTTYQALLDVQCSARYHSIAERWFVGFRRLTNFLNLFLGSAVAVTALNSMPGLASLSGIAVVLTSILDTVYDSAGKISQHRNLYQRYLDLESDIRQNGLSVEAIDAKIAQIERDEPPVNERLREIAYDANLRTAGHRERSELTGLNRFLANWL